MAVLEKESDVVLLLLKYFVLYKNMFCWPEGCFYTGAPVSGKTSYLQSVLLSQIEQNCLSTEGLHLRRTLGLPIENHKNNTQIIVSKPGIFEPHTGQQ